jgi:hypothetical protein
MKAYGEWKYSSTILDLGTRWEWSLSCPYRFTPGERVPSTHCTGDLDGPHSLDTAEYGKIFLPLPGIEPRQSSL